MIDISIIICTYNRSQLLKDTLTSCDKLHYITDIEVIVVDNNSTDHTQQIVESWMGFSENKHIKKVYLFEACQGLSFARNTGIANAQGRIIAFLDDDAIPSEQWLCIMYKSFVKYPDALAIGGKILPRFEIDRPDWLTSNFDNYLSIMDFGDFEQEYPSNLFPFGANMAFRREVFDSYTFSNDLGRKGMSLLSGEETYLFRSIAQHGKIYYIPDMYVNHFVTKERLTKKWMLSRLYAQGVSDVRQNRVSIDHFYFLKKLGSYYRCKARMAISLRYRENFEKQSKLAILQGIIDEILNRSNL